MIDAESKPSAGLSGEVRTKIEWERRLKAWADCLLRSRTLIGAMVIDESQGIKFDADKWLKADVDSLKRFISQPSLGYAGLNGTGSESEALKQLTWAERLAVVDYAFGLSEPGAGPAKPSAEDVLITIAEALDRLWDSADNVNLTVVPGLLSNLGQLQAGLASYPSQISSNEHY